MIRYHYLSKKLRPWNRYCTIISAINQGHGADTVSVLGRDEGYTVKNNPLPKGVPEGEARGNS